MTLHAELHRHLGGSVVPRILWRYFDRHNAEMVDRFQQYSAFEEFYTRPRNTLDEYLELHTLVESVQTVETLPYFIYRLMRGAYVFENLAYLELRYTPYLRTPEHLDQSKRIDLMAEIVQVVGKASQISDCPIVTSQILCMHSRLPYEVNRAIVDLAAQMGEYVCAIDLAGGDAAIGDRLDEFVGLYQYARSIGIKTTGHLYETSSGCYPGQCLEVCPTTYLKTGTLQDMRELKVVFDRCFEAGVDIAICTDNAGLHNVRLPFEYENLLTLDIIDFRQLQACQDAAFRHAFAWPYGERPVKMLTGLLQHESVGAIVN
ncbi:MAG: adenosine deaminase [Microcoleus sp. PH2017_04_SCI_O_A]|nr:adenosine deaminase [Microcoleus sp. PH2017_04_SCI_O_A]